uniref:C2H2-type domain-containing protein n=1 Tax=Kalanchoe fedtschenkoi TaxID=63787 RepID=A0A7N0VA91_KALFE
MGNLDSPYAQVTAFYSYWLGFSTVMDFCWVDQYDALAGPNRKSRRVMEEENKKLRRKAKREYNDTVRGLAEYVKKRDKRVIDMQIKKDREMEKKKEQERERKKEMERIKSEKAQAYQDPEWARVEDEDIFEDEVSDQEENKELYCVVCRKKFKSDKQWKNHEQSRKHKDKVSEFRDAYSQEGTLTEQEEEEEEAVDQANDHDGTIMDETDSRNVAKKDLVSELEEQFHDRVKICEVESVEGMSSGNEENGDSTVNSVDEERDLLEAMLTGRRNRREAASIFLAETHPNANIGVKHDLECKNNRSSRRTHNGKEKGNKHSSEMLRHDADVDGNIDEIKEAEIGYSQANQSSSINASMETKTNGRSDPPPEENKTTLKKPVRKKVVANKDTQTVPKSNAKGKKSKGTKASGNACDACGEVFESKNKLHKHLGETGHATLKKR